MSEAAQMIARAKEIRLRLRRPANAVFDDGINLKRKKEVRRLVIASAPVATAEMYSMPIMVRSTITVASIIKAVAAYYGTVTPRDIRSPTRQSFVVKARHMVFYLASEHCRISTVLIGKRAGGRDHSTVIHGRDVIRDRIASNDPFTVKAISELEQILYAGLDHHRSALPAVGQCDLAQPSGEGVQEQNLQSVAQGSEPPVAHAEGAPLPEELTQLLQAGGDFLATGQEGTGLGQSGEGLQ